MPVIRDTVKTVEGEEVEFYIEVDEQVERVFPTGVDRSAPGRSPYGDTRGPAEDVQEALQKALTIIRTCAEQVAHTVQGIPAQMRPNEVEVEFGIKIDAQVGALLAKASTEAQLQVTLKWCEKEASKP